MTQETYGVTLERLQRLLESEDLAWQRAGDNGVYVSFTNMTVLLHLSEWTFTIRAYWRGTSTAPTDTTRLIEFANDFNYNRSIPKLFIHGDASEESPLGLVMEYGFPSKYGLSETQLRDTFLTLMGTFMSGMTTVEGRFPELVTWNEEVN